MGSPVFEWFVAHAFNILYMQQVAWHAPRSLHRNSFFLISLFLCLHPALKIKVLQKRQFFKASDTTQRLNSVILKERSKDPGDLMFSLAEMTNKGPKGYKKSLTANELFISIHQLKQ